MKNKAIILEAGGGYDQVTVVATGAAYPKAGEIAFRLHANSLSYHDFAVGSLMKRPFEPLSLLPMTRVK